MDKSCSFVSDFEYVVWGVKKITGCHVEVRGMRSVVAFRLAATSSGMCKQSGVSRRACCGDGVLVEVTVPRRVDCVCCFVLWECFMFRVHREGQ